MNLKLLVLLLLLIVPCVLAKEQSMHLLAVKELGNNTFEGSSAELFLEVVPGNGHIFIETFPATKIDTQLSTRFAKEVACAYVDVDCSAYNFMYRIRADSSIIGGPSAGASITALTVAALQDFKINNSVAVTGSISDGGIVGSVGALKAKLDSAKLMNVSKVLVPKQDLLMDENVNLSAYAKSLNISLIGVSSLDEVLYEFTGRNFSKSLQLTKNQLYSDIMKNISVDLCNRSDYLLNLVKTYSKSESFKEAVNFTNLSKKEFNASNFYSSASYCYRANVKLKYLELNSKNYSKEEIGKLITSAQEQSAYFRDELNFSNIKTINDLQAYMIVDERITEADDYLSEAMNSSDDLNESISLVSLAIERLYSVNVWSAFFGSGSFDYFFDESSVKDSCVMKLAEAQERIQYGKFYFPQILTSAESTFADAQSDLEKGDYVLCLFKASRAKAEVDAVISVFGVNETGLPVLLNSKIGAAESFVARQSSKGDFPILAYSYLEYAKSLKDSDPSASLLYSSYALEFSNLNLYLAKEPVLFNMDEERFRTGFTFVMGFLIGGIVFYYYLTFSIRNAMKRN